jgi:hypothetical protein
MLSCRYSQLVTNRCCKLACLLLETPFVTRDVFCLVTFVCGPRFHCIQEVLLCPLLPQVL